MCGFRMIKREWKEVQGYRKKYKQELENECTTNSGKDVYVDGKMSTGYIPE